MMDSIDRFFMKPRCYNQVVLLPLLALSTLNYQISTAEAEGTAFTYQGRLNISNSPANGLYQMSFTLWSAATNGQDFGTIFTNGVPVSSGLFTVTLDFGPGVFTGAPEWLGINVNTNGAGTYLPL